ncbi:hypothetical protein [Flavobacterium sp.]|uniref:hypothetical protein n=1 Tax=Flavobacterium sp. TaxID=239 RepID=UPI0025C70700|nr:hypothetical protein [Flavobacterium sp.]
MQKFLLFLNKYAVPFNSFFIAFWLYMIYTNYVNNGPDGNVKSYIIPVLFIFLCLFNIYAAVNKKKKN